MTVVCCRLRPRRGAILIVTLLLSVTLLAMVSFTVDVGYIVSVETQLQNAADAAALAGVVHLEQPYVSYSQPLQSSSAKAGILTSAMAAANAETVRIGGLNQAGEVASLALLRGDIVCGFLGGGAFRPTPPDADFPNLGAGPRAPG